MDSVSYFPFGGVRTSTAPLDTDKLFTGQRLDQTGLYFYNARYYDATIGRFISPDTIVPNPANPQSLNRYSYCMNNPLKYIDPSGHAGIGGGEEGDPDPIYGVAPPWIASNIPDCVPEDLFTQLGGKKGGIDSDWGDMLSRAYWGDTFTITVKGETMEIMLVQGVGFVSEHKVIDFAGVMFLTTAMRDQGNIPKLTLYGQKYGTKGHSFKLDDGHKTGDKIKNVAKIGGGILLCAGGSLSSLAGLVTGNTWATVLGGWAAKGGWELASDGIYHGSGGKYCDPITTANVFDIAYSGIPLLYIPATGWGDWGLSPSGWNGFGFNY